MKQERKGRKYEILVDGARSYPEQVQWKEYLEKYGEGKGDLKKIERNHLLQYTEREVYFITGRNTGKNYKKGER